MQARKKRPLSNSAGQPIYIAKLTTQRPRSAKTPDLRPQADTSVPTRPQRGVPGRKASEQTTLAAGAPAAAAGRPSISRASPAPARGPLPVQACGCGVAQRLHSATPPLDAEVPGPMVRTCHRSRQPVLGQRGVEGISHFSVRLRANCAGWLEG